MFEPNVRDGVLQLRVPGARWLSTGVDGGFRRTDAAYNVAVPEGFSRTDVTAYATERRRAVGFDEPGPALLTGVDMANARCARAGQVAVVATAGLSNPAALPMRPSGIPEPTVPSGAPGHDGTVNLLVATTRALDDGALSNLIAVAAEAKAATLVAETGFPGTTTDAVVVGCDPDGERAAFSGSGTTVGSDVRACVREALSAALHSRHPDGGWPETVADADHGVSTNRRAEVFRPGPPDDHNEDDP